jgi:hypothetical protein
MKRLFLLALAIPWLFSSCMTRQVLARAQGKPLPGECDYGVQEDPSPLYYVMLPISIPVDAVFYPFGYFSRRAAENGEW